MSPRNYKMVYTVANFVSISNPSLCCCKKANHPPHRIMDHFHFQGTYFSNTFSTGRRVAFKYDVEAIDLIATTYFKATCFSTCLHVEVEVYKR